MAEAVWALWALPLAGALQLAMARDNMRHFQAVMAGPAASGTVSVLVPARDEALRIGDCVSALLSQAEADEVLVLDDGSTDGTAEAARAAAGGDSRFQVFEGRSLGAGWVGKAHACAQLSERARGDWLVFVDADVTLRPGAVAEAVRRAAATEAGLLSFWPRQALGSWGERLIVPMLDVVLFGFLPFRLAANRSEPALAAANGQCLVFRASAYRAMGGHAAVKGELVEDVALARAMKRAGHRVVLTDAGAWASVRMYTGLRSAWAGFTKNLYPAFGGRPAPFLAGLSLFAGSQALPFWLALVALAAGQVAWAAPLAVQAALAFALRALLVRGLGHPITSALAHPLSGLLVLGLALASWRASASGHVTWKGRVYGHEAAP